MRRWCPACPPPAALWAAPTISTSPWVPDPGLYCLSSADIVTEVEAIKMMFNCEAKVVCAGGIGGNEGAHYWAVDGDEADIKALVDYLEKEIKGEPPVKGNKGNCSNCRYPGCRYNGLQPDQLPDWMKKRGIKK